MKFEVYGIYGIQYCMRYTVLYTPVMFPWPKVSRSRTSNLQYSESDWPAGPSPAASPAAFETRRAAGRSAGVDARCTGAMSERMFGAIPSQFRRSRADGGVPFRAVPRSSCRASSASAGGRSLPGRTLLELQEATWLGGEITEWRVFSK